MSFELLYVIFVMSTVLNYIFLDIKVDKMKKESLDKDKVIGSLMAHNQALRKLNELFRGHERRIDNIERTLVIIGKFEKPEEPEKPEKHEESKHTCKDCDYYRALYGNYYMCKQTGCFCSTECDTPCDVFKKKESLDEDENVVYANNVKINISSNGSRLYMADRLLTSEELVDRIRKLYLDGGINYDDANTLLERLKQ